MYGTQGSNLAIGISLIMRDNFTGRAQSASAALSQLDRQAMNMARSQMTMQRNIAAIGAGVGIAAIRGMASWVKTGSEFGYTMRYVETLTKDKGGMAIDGLTKKVKDLGAQTMFTSQEIADGAKYMAMAGQSTTQIYNNLEAAVNLAGATMSRIEGKGGAADIMTNIMKGFNIEDTEANSMRVADILTAAVTGANTNLHDLHEGMKYAVSTASTLGGGIEEVAASLMILGNAGIQGSMAGVALENTYRYIARAANEAKKNKQGDALAALGLQPHHLKDSNGQLLSLSGILHLISGQFDKLSAADRAKGLNTVFGYNVMADLVNVRGNRAALKLAQNLGQFDDFVTMLSRDSSGTATRNMAEMMDTLEGSTIQLTSAWDNFKIAFTDALEPILIPLLKTLTKGVVALTKMLETPLGKFLAIAAAGFVVLKTAVFSYRVVVLSLRLAHLNMAASFGNSSTSVVSGYGRMTRAAQNYTAAAAAAAATGGGITTPWRRRTGGWLGYGSGRVRVNKQGRYIDTKTGRFISEELGNRYSHVTYNRRSGYLGAGQRPPSRLGNFGRYAKIGSIPAIVGGMAASMGAEYTRDEETGKLSNTGVALDAFGTGLGWAGTGAMLGSMVGPVGTAVGAIVGGVGGIVYSLYNNLSDIEDAIAEVKIPSGEEWNEEDWRRKVNLMERLGDAPVLYGKGYTSKVEDMVATTQMGAAKWIAEKGEDPTQIVVNIDGRKAMDKIVRDRQRELLIDLATF